MKIIASIEDPFVISKILSYLEARCCLQGPENHRPRAVGQLQRFASHLKSHGRPVGGPGQGRPARAMAARW